MTDILARLTMELERVMGHPVKDSSAKGVGTVRFIINCPNDASSVLERAKSVMAAVDSAALHGWPSNNHAVPILPEWFTSACAPEMSKEAEDQWLKWWKGLSRKERVRVDADKNWGLSNWLYWLEPGNRQWFWRESSVQEESDQILLTVEVEGWPFPWGALSWLFRAAGAATVVEDE